MAELRIPVDRLERGEFPAVSAVSGRPSDGRVTIVYRRDPPGWTLILLFVGIVPYLAARLWALRWVQGDLPVERLAWDRYVILRRRSRVSWTWFAVGVLVITVVVVATSEVTTPSGLGPLYFGLVENRLPGAVQLALALAIPIGALIVHMRWAIGTIVPGKLDPRAECVILRDVHPDFIRACAQGDADRLARQ